jgi:hypothetical protein
VVDNDAPFLGDGTVSSQATYAYDQIAARHRQADHARLASEARAAGRRARAPRPRRARQRGIWFPGRPLNLPA